MSQDLIRTVTRLVLMLALVLAIAIAWGNSHQNEDLVMAIVAGRDVVEGHLGDPDRWSFTTQGKVWVNQGWFSGLLFYLSYAGLHYAGPVLLKGLLLVLCLVPLYRRCRRLDASADVSLLAVSVGTLGVATLMSIRAENFGIVYFVLLTTLLTRPAGPGFWRYLGAVALILIWSNSHGSFLIGVVLVGVKAVLQLLRYGAAPAIDRLLSQPGEGGEGTHRSGIAAGMGARGTVFNDGVKWGLTCLCCIVVVAVANPFGLSNLTMPFRQVSAVWWTTSVNLWQPLIQWGGDSGIVLYMGELSLFYLGAVALVGALAILTVFNSGLRTILQRLMARQNDPSGGDLLMEVSISIFMVLLSFRFGRTAVFAGLAIVPTLAWLMRSVLGSLNDRGTREAERHTERRPAVALLFLSTALMALTVWVFCARTIPTYLFEHPSLEDSLVRRTFGTPRQLSDLTTFVEKNRISGRLFSDLLLSDLLLLRVPNIQVFMDLRAQSIYSDRVCRDYLTVALVDVKNQASVKSALRVLENYGISTVVLPMDSDYWSSLIVALFNSKAWRPLYVDPSGFVFVKADSSRLRTAGTSGTLDVWFPNERSRILTAAYLMLGSQGRIAPALEMELKKLALTDPNHLIYRSLALASRRTDGHLSDSVRSYFLGELNRLGNIHLDSSTRYETVLGSMIEILQALEFDASSRAGRSAAEVYAQKIRELAALHNRIRSERSPWPSY